MGDRTSIWVYAHWKGNPSIDKDELALNIDMDNNV